MWSSPLPFHFSSSISPHCPECSSFSPPATVILLILLCFEGLLFLIFTSVMFGTQVHSICTDETVSDPFSNQQSSYPFISLLPNALQTSTLLPPFAFLKINIFDLLLLIQTVTVLSKVAPSAAWDRITYSKVPLKRPKTLCAKRKLLCNCVAFIMLTATLWCMVAMLWLWNHLTWQVHITLLSALKDLDYLFCMDNCLMSEFLHQFLPVHGKTCWQQLYADKTGGARQ